MASQHSAIPLLLLLVILLIAAGSSTSSAYASSLNVNLTEQSITLKYNMELLENFSGNLNPLPISGVSLDAHNSSTLVQSIQAAMQRLVPQAGLDPSQLRFEASTVLQNPALNMWAIRENMTATVTGVRSARTGITSFNMGFLSMNMSDPILLSGVEFNNVGASTLLPLLSNQAASNPPSVTVYYADGGGPYSNTVIPGNVTVRFNMFDFSRIPKVSSWDNVYRPLDSSSTWTYDTSKLLGQSLFNLTLGLRSPEQVFFKSYTAFYKPTLVVTAPPRAWADGSTILFDAPTAPDLVMPVVILASVSVLVGSYAFEKRFSSQPFQSKKKRREHV